MRIVADHSRGAAFLIADGVVPSNEDRGYILRRIMRRAIQQGRAIGIESPFMDKFAERALELLAPAYPELAARARHGPALGPRRGGELRPHPRARHRAARRAGRRGEGGRHLVDRRRRRLQAPRHLRLSLRPDQGAARRRGPLGRRPGLRGADGRAAPAGAGGDRDRARLRGRARRGARLRLGGAAVAVRRLREARFRDQPDRGRGRRRPGPRQARGEPLLRRGRRPGRRYRRRALERQRGGGRGRLPRRRRPSCITCARLLRFASGAGLGGVAGWATGGAEVDHVARHATMRNHTATHLLHAALRERLGTHVRQAGSSVRPDKLRFDFTHGAPLAVDEMRAVDDRVNEWIKESHPVRAIEMAHDDAVELGAMALFGEKYGEWVRMVEVEGVSRELCGGTHVANTAEIGIFAISTEGSSAANVRRIEALTGPAAIDRFRNRSRQLSEVGRVLGSEQDPLAGRPARRRAPRRAREDRARGRRRGRQGEGRRARRGRRGDRPGQGGRRQARRARRQAAPAGVTGRSSLRWARTAAIVLGSAAGGMSRWSPASAPKPSMPASKPAMSSARRPPSSAAAAAGRDDFARAGGKDAAKLDDALEAARKAIESTLGNS